MRILLALSFSILLSNAIAQNKTSDYSDSLRIYFVEMERGDKYWVGYNDRDEYFKCDCNKNDRCYYYLSFKRDSSDTLRNGNIPIDIFKKSVSGYVKVPLLVMNDPSLKFLAFYSSDRVKKRYAIDYMWLDKVNVDSRLHGKYIRAIPTNR